MERPIRILVVDDEAGFRFSARFLLEHKGFRVVEAMSGEEALSRVIVAQRRNEPFDLLIADIFLPGISGLELLAEIRAREIPVPHSIIVGTGNPEPFDRANTEEVIEWLEKPFTPDELLDKVAEVLATRKTDAA